MLNMCVCAIQYSSVEDNPHEDQWVSEGIQIGGAGSQIGVLGMWTGASHDIDDPLGESGLIFELFPLLTFPTSMKVRFGNGGLHK